MTLLSLAVILTRPALATDTWTTVRTGVDYLHRTTSDPQDIYAVRIDLTVPNVGLHASADLDGAERHTTTSTFASSADVLVAINGDWSDGNTPVGLAISDGWQWHDHIGDDTVGGQWGYFACTATKTCTIDAELPLDQAWWFSTPTIAPYRYFQAVGANGEILVSNGVAESGCYDTAHNPRSAICLEADGTHLWLVAIDGRTSSADGMTCDQTRDLMLDLGCWSAAMLDGGGSTTLVIDGDVKNNPSDGSPRTVSNHLGIVYSDTLDPACTVSSGRWCDGTVISTCQGGRHLGSGDCAAYGATCEEDGDYAYCVDYRCPGGSGSGAACLDGTNVAYCTDGQYGEGDCGVFGLTCGTDDGGSSCMDARCEAGPHSDFCTDAGLYATCTDGLYAEAACADGWVCFEDAASQGCGDPMCPAGPDSAACTDAGVLETCAGGSYSARDCAAEGLTCDALEGCVGGGGDSAADNGGNGGGPGQARRLDEAGGCGCATGDQPRGAGWQSLVAVLAAGIGARRRRATRTA